MTFASIGPPAPFGWAFAPRRSRAAGAAPPLWPTNASSATVESETALAGEADSSRWENAWCKSVWRFEVTACLSRR